MLIEFSLCEWEHKKVYINPAMVVAVSQRTNLTETVVNGSRIFVNGCGSGPFLVKEDCETVVRMVQEAQRKGNDHV